MRCTCGVENKDTNSFCTGCGERLIRGRQAVDLGGQTMAAQPDATQFTDPTSAPEADQAVKTQLTESHTVNADQSQVKEQEVPAEWKVGDVILDLYEVKDLLGEGGFGRVFKVHHKGWNIDLAVKSPRSDRFKSDAERENFVRECETWINLGMHPNIVSCHYVRSINGVPNVFAEYVEGGSLHEWIEDRRLYAGGKEEALKRILDISIQFAWGLHYAHTHEQGLIHQDIKPGNVLITPMGEAKVTDFGLARARAASGEVPVKEEIGRTVLVPGAGMLTPAYCSPEQVEGKALSRKTDIWSWGLCILEMFKGERTWESGTLAMVALDENLKNGVEDNSIPRMPDSLANLLNECFQKEPKDRPDSFKDITDRLLSIYEKECKFGEYPPDEPEAAKLLADGLNNRALSMLDLGRKKESQNFFDEALKADPHHLEATFNSGLLLWRAGQITDEELCLRLEEVRTTDVDRVSYLLGLVHLERGDAESALEALKRVAQPSSDVSCALRIAQDRLRQAVERRRSFEDHKYAIHSLAITPDGSFVFSAGNYGMLELWELSTGRCVCKLSGHTKAVLDVSVSGDGRRVLSCGVDKTVRLWEATTGDPILTLEGHTDRVNSVSISSDGCLAISGDEGGHVKIWDLMQGRAIHELDCQSRVKICVAITAKWAVFGSKDLPCSVIDLDSGRCLSTFANQRNGVSSIVISKDGALALSSRIKSMRLWKLPSGELLRTYNGHRYPITSIAMTPDGSLGVSGSINGRFLLWEVVTGRCLRSFYVDNSSVEAVAISREGQDIVAGFGGPKKLLPLQLWKISAGIPAHEIICRPKTFKSSSKDQKEVELLKTKAESALISGDAKSAYLLIQRARSIAGYSRTPDLLDLHREIGLNGRATGILDGWHVRVLGGHQGGVHTGAIFEDGRLAVTGGDDKTLRVWDTSSGNCIHVLEGHTSFVNCVACVSTDRSVISGSPDRTIRVWDANSGKCLRILDSYSWPICSLAVSPDSELAMVSGRPRPGFREVAPIWLIRLSDGKCMRIFEGHSEEVNALSFSPDGRYGLAGSFGEVRVWDLSKGKCLKVIRGHKGSIYSVQFTEGLQRVLSAGGQASICEIATGECLRSYGQGGRVLCAAHTMDGRFLVSGSGGAVDKAEGGTARPYPINLWELESGRCLRILEQHSRAVYSVCISSDGRHILSTGGWGEARIWELLWEYEFPKTADFDEGVRPYLEAFLTVCCPRGKDGIGRTGKPTWDEKDFEKLISDLKYCGYGWLRPKGVKHELEKMAAQWEGPPPLPWEIPPETIQKKPQNRTIALSAKERPIISKQRPAAKAVSPPRNVFVVGPKVPRKVLGSEKTVPQNVLNELIIEVMGDDVRGERVIKDPRPDMAVQRETLGLYNEKLASTTECPKCKTIKLVSFLNKRNKQIFHMCFNCGFDDRSAISQKTQPSSQVPHRRVNKVGRQEPCPCGSGKKFKHCCGVRA